jgi:hypothetical protein
MLASKSSTSSVSTVLESRPPRTLLLMAPDWVRSELGGPHARLSVEKSIANLANTMDAQAGTAGLQYLDYRGRRVPW